MPADPQIRILSVDDFATMRKIIRSLLRKLGYSNVAEADDGSSALTLLKKEQFDMIISDWNMPRMTGLELLKAVRSDPALKDIPFLMVTAEAEKANIVAAVQAGVNNYIVKPFTAETLQHKIDKIFP